jgi:nucleotide-binding universal stress UspA family protein
MKTFNNILMPTDFSELSFAGAEYAATIAKMYGAKVYLLHVVLEPLLAPPFPNVDLNAETLLRDNVEAARISLDDEANHRFKDSSNIITVVRKGEPWREIVRFAQAQDVDLIVMATHGRTGFSHAVLGSVAEKVVRYSTIPVLTIKPDQANAAELSDKSVVTEHSFTEHQ